MSFKVQNPEKQSSWIKMSHILNSWLENVPSVEEGQSPKRCDSLKENQGPVRKRRKNECLTTKMRLMSTTVFSWKISTLENYFKEQHYIITSVEDETIENFYLSVN